MSALPLESSGLPCQSEQSKEDPQPDGLHSAEHCQQVEGGDSTPLLSSTETHLEVQASVIEFPVQERHGYILERV